MRDRVRILVRIAAMTWATDPLRSGIAVVLTASDYASSALAALGVKYLVDAAARDDPSAATAGVVLLVLTIAAGQGAGFGAFAVGVGLRERVGHRLETEIARMVASHPRIELLERPEYLDRLSLLKEQTGDLARFQDSLVQIVGVAVRLGASLVLLATVDPRLVVLALFGLPSVAATVVVSRLVQRRERQRAPVMRRASILNWYTTSSSAAQEIRIFGAGDDLQRRIHDDRVEVDDIIRRANLRIALVQTSGWAFFGIGFVITLPLVASAAARGEASTGDLAMVVAIGAQLNGQLGAVSTWLTGIMDMVRVAGHYQWVSAFAEEGSTAEAACRVRGDITLDHVTFRYPGTTEDVLQDISLTIPEGSTVAIVGENGAGKTTLIKLLTGLYEPTTGSISVGTQSLGQISPRQWRSQLSGAFQDTPPLEFLVREVIGLGDVRLLEDADTVATAASAGGAEGLVQSLPSGLETRLGKSFDGGTNLSGGQWQHLALARAMMRPRPRLLMLDEPTANLDPQAEAAVFERHAVALREAGNGDGAAILISHRFSTVREADQIVVLTDGRVAERGTHRELIAMNGLYAELFRLQAQGYAN